MLNAASYFNVNPALMLTSMSALGRKPTVDLHHNIASSLSDWTVDYRPRAGIETNNLAEIKS